MKRDRVRERERERGGGGIERERGDATGREEFLVPFVYNI